MLVFYCILLLVLIAGNLLGQGAIFWNKLIPFGLKRGIILGIITGLSLWLVLFLPLTTYVIQPKLDMFSFLLQINMSL